MVLDTGEGTFTLTVMDGDRFTETGETGGVASTRRGGYTYARTGPDAGRWTLAYDGGSACAAHLYFASPAAGWFASRCTSSEYPDGYWIGGSWSVEGNGDGEEDGDDVAETAYGVNDALPGVPTSGAFAPTITGGGSVLIAGSSTTISLDEGAYFEASDGTRYTCTAASGCTIANGTVTAGTVTGRVAGTGEVDRFPTFRAATTPDNRTYTVGTAIDTLTLPEATGGNGTLTYSLSPAVPGLAYDASTRQVTGTPSTAGTYAMTYTVTDEDGDTDTLGFTIAISAGTSTEGSLGVCQVGMTLSSGQSCTYPGTTDAFSVNARGRGSFLGRLAGIRIRIDNQTIDGRVYDFEASHQGDGVWRIDRIAGSTEPPDTTPTDGGAGSGMVGNFELLSGHFGSTGFAYANDRFYFLRWQDDKVYAYTGTGQHDPDNDFDLPDVSIFDRLAYANDRFYVFNVQEFNDQRLFAYTGTGQRDASNDVLLQLDNYSRLLGVAYANGRIYVLTRQGNVYAYTTSGDRDRGS